MVHVTPEFIQQIKVLTSQDRPNVTAVLSNTPEFAEIKRQLGDGHNIVECADSPPEGKAFGVLVAVVENPSRYIDLLKQMGVAAAEIKVADITALNPGRRQVKAFVMTHADANDILSNDRKLSAVYTRNEIIR